MQTNYTTLKIYLVLLDFFLFLFLLQLVFFFFAPFNFCGSMKQPFHHQSAIFSNNNVKKSILIHIHLHTITSFEISINYSS